LPLGDFVEHGIGDGADHRGRDLDLVELLQMRADLAHGEPARVQREHLGVEAPGSRRTCFGMSCGSKVPLRSRGRSSVSVSSSVRTVFGDAPFR
jgi:hypothetical protein